ncbi:MAG: hypothetical protein O3C05_01935 [Proteobacteria bacterium]|nr:hypothetical protein [Pseudomonadota bacterium]
MPLFLSSNVKCTLTVYDIKRTINNFDIIAHDKKFNGISHHNINANIEEATNRYAASNNNNDIGIFINIKLAEESIKNAIYYNRYKITDWINNNSTASSITLNYTEKNNIGYVITKKSLKKTIGTNTLTLALKKNGACDFYVYNAYPILNKN